MLYTGTTVTYGRGRVLVVTTGMQTEFGAIATLLDTVEIGRTPLQENLDRVGHVLARGAFAVVALIVALGVWRGQDLLEMVIFGIALAWPSSPKPSRRWDDLAGARGAAHGQAACPHPPTARRRDARVHLRDLFRQDGHVDQGRDDRSDHRRRRRHVRGDRGGL